ncbi:MAG: hypothetical protein ABIP07_04505 [Sphingomicrobium sp.]
MLRRCTIAFIALTTSFAATAAGVGPEIAFLKDGGRAGKEVYLVNPDGTGLRKIHAAQGIEQIALRPDGRELALSFGGNIRFISLNESGVPGSTRDVKGSPLVGDMDYRADGTLIYSIATWPRQVRTIAPGVATSELIFTVPGNISGLKWMRDGVSVIFDNDNIVMKRNAAGEISTLASPGYFPAFLGMVRTADRAIVASWTASSSLDLTSGAVSSTCKPMSMMSFSANDAQMVYRQPAGPYNGTYLLVQKTDCSGGVIRLGSRGAFLDVDWRK